MPSYKLVYFDTAGRGEITRLIFQAAGEKFEDERVKDWPAKKAGTRYLTNPNFIKKNHRNQHKLLCVCYVSIQINRDANWSDAVSGSGRS